MALSCYHHWLLLVLTGHASTAYSKETYIIEFGPNQLHNNLDRSQTVKSLLPILPNTSLMRYKTMS